MDKPKRLGISISADAGKKLKILQSELERTLGFEPSVTQIVEHLITKETQKSTPDTNGQTEEA
jgi:hypothetical protein